MSKLRHLTFGALTLLTVATAAGCGTAGMPSAPVQGLAAIAGNAIDVQGVSRKLGFDMNRYKTVLAPKAHPKKMPRQGMLPNSTDLRNLCSPIADQGQLGACTAFAMGKGLRELLENKNHEQFTALSPMFLYYEERRRQGSINEDSGATITEGMGVLKETGIAPEALCAYNVPGFKLKPSAEAYKAAGQFKIQEATQLAGLDDVKASLAKGQPVAFGFMVYKSFMSVGKNGVMSLPKPGEKVLGGHAVLAVGYDDAKKQLIVRNSWNTTWGDKGYFYMPYEFVNDENTGDFWTSGK
jgi:C1A family cysteine protease